VNEILFKIFPFLAKHMSNRASGLLSGFGLLALLVLGLYMLSLSGFKESSGILFVVFLGLLAMIPVSFLILWILEIKHEWEMRVVTVVPQSGHPFPQNAINAKKAGYRFRKPTKEERAEWGLDKRAKLSEMLHKFIHITNDQIEAKSLEEKLGDPNLPFEEFIKIRNEQERQKQEAKPS